MMKNVIRILLAAAVVAVAAPAEVSAQGFLRKVGNAVEKAAEKVDGAVKKADEALNGTSGEQQQQPQQPQQTRRLTPREAAAARLAQQDAAAAARSGGAGSGSSNAPAVDLLITMMGAGPFTFGNIAVGQSNGYTVTQNADGNLDVKNAADEVLIRYFPNGPSLIAASPFKLEGDIAGGVTTVAEARAVMGEAWGPPITEYNDNNVRVMYAYNIYLVFSLEAFADGGAKWKAEKAAGRKWSPTLDDLKPDAQIAFIEVRG
jgi:hypothetical protein